MIPVERSPEAGPRPRIGREANAPVPSVTRIFVGLSSRPSSHQQIYWSTSTDSLGLPTELLIVSSPIALLLLPTEDPAPFQLDDIFTPRSAIPENPISYGYFSHIILIRVKYVLI